MNDKTLLYSDKSLTGHARVGASWEGFALEQFLLIVKPSEAFFWATHSGVEVDLFFLHKGRHYGVEIKFSEAPRVTKSMRIAIDDLNLRHLWIIYPGGEVYPVDERITVWPLQALISSLIKSNEVVWILGVRIFMIPDPHNRIQESIKPGKRTPETGCGTSQLSCGRTNVFAFILLWPPAPFFYQFRPEMISKAADLIFQNRECIFNSRSVAIQIPKYMQKAELDLSTSVYNNIPGRLHPVELKKFNICQSLPDMSESHRTKLLN